MDFSSSAWLFAVLGGAILLGLAIAYGVFKSAKTSPREEQVGEQATRDLYHKDQAKH